MDRDYIFVVFFACVIGLGLLLALLIPATAHTETNYMPVVFKEGMPTPAPTMDPFAPEPTYPPPNPTPIPNNKVDSDG
jgi:hypothetical protein